MAVPRAGADSADPDPRVPQRRAAGYIGAVPIASSIEEGLAAVRSLVAQFAENETHYASKDFDETSTREQFINRLFEALGWDVLDAAGLGAQREVVFHPRVVDELELTGEESWDDDLSEEQLAEREPVARVPDYAFRLDGAPQFFIEAKRAGVSVDSRPPAFQVKSYAWSQHVRVGVLTNFRRLRVFECLVRPAYDQPDAGLLGGLSLDYTEYEAAWPRLWGLLSREAVVGGSIEALGRAPRGSLRVGDAFLEELTQWRETLARDLAARNRDLNRWELAEATQRILDRLIFLRVCEDRTVEQSVVLRRYARRQDAYHELCIEFRRLDEVYNGALFAEHFSERLEVSDGVIQRLIERLYFPFSPYRFDVIGVDLLGAAYERFLGKELSLDARGRVTLEDKPEVRHAGGVYYTPRWVVDEIVAGCLDPLLDGRTPRTAANLRIVDPACGSGSFLLGALDYLIRWHEDYYAQNPHEDQDRHHPARDGSIRLTSDAKAALVTQNLFGVDIDPQAVEVAQMSLYLKILEAETGATLHHQIRLFPGPYLPSLSNNIRCGNSLLAQDDVPSRLLFDDDLRRRINPFDWRDAERGFGKVFDERGGFDAVIGNPPYTRVQVLRRMRAEEAELYEQNFITAEGSYDIATLFVERGLTLLRPRRREAKDRGGRLGFIITRTFCETDSAAPLRSLLSDGQHVEEIVDFGSGTVFEEASAYTLLLRATAAPSQELVLTRVPPPPSPEALTSARAEQSPLTATIPPASLGGEKSWPLMLPAEQALLDRLAAAHPSLGEVTGDDVFQGVITGADGIFRCNDVGPHPQDAQLRMVVPQSHGAADPIAIEREVLRPVVAGSNDLHRFRWTPSAEWVIFPYERVQPTDRYVGMTASGMKKRHPHAYAWLERNHEALKARAPQSRSAPWTDENWMLYSRRQNLERFGEPKVLVPYMVKELCAVADGSGHYFVNVTTGGYGLGSSPRFDMEPEYLAALLNSELLSWALKRYSRAWRGDYYGARKGNLVRLPIAIPAAAARAALVAAYDQCRLAAEAVDSARSDMDRGSLGRLYPRAVQDFDRLVFETYAITADELAAVRSA